MKKLSKENTIILIAGILSFIYVAARAYLIPAYHDEINSFFLYIQTGDFQPFYSNADTNNHVLNTLFAHLFFLLFGDHIFILRLANLLSYAIYLIFVWKIGNTFSSRWLKISWFATMISSLYVLSFFSLARGYGISMAMLVTVIYYLLEYSKTHATKSILLGVFASSVGVWAYMGLMIPGLVAGLLFGVLFLQYMINSRNLKHATFVVPGAIFLFAIPFYYAITYSLFIKAHSEIYGSEAKSFLKAVVFNGIDDFSGKPGSYTGYVTVAVIALTLVATALTILLKKQFKSPALLIQLLLWGTAAGTIALNHLFGVEYPEGRMAVYYYILIMAPLFVSINETKNTVYKIAGYVVTAVMFIQFIVTFNFSYAPCWRYGTLPKEIFAKIADESRAMKYLPTISANPIMDRQYQYDNFIARNGLNSPQTNKFPSQISDFIIANNSIGNAPVAGYDTVYYDFDTQVYLLKRQKEFEWIQVSEAHNIQFEGNQEYFDVTQVNDAEEFRNLPFCFDVDFNAQSERFPFRCILVCDVWNKQNKSLESSYIYLQSLYSDATSPAHFHQRIYLENIPETAETIKIFFYNQLETNIRFSDLHISVLKGIKKSSRKNI